ncbi:MAG TPA: universal stress protein [Nevskiaceae bacterium]|nr:universal stress protein [Nevskiaceae bacterium]
MTYRRILLIADPSMQLTPACHRAERLARISGAELYVDLFDDSRAVRAIGAMSPKLADVLRVDLIKQRQLWLRSLADRLHNAGVLAHTSVVWGSRIQERILERVAEVKPDLVVKDVHLEPLLKRVLFTPLDWQLLRTCPLPLLMVRGGSRKVPRRVIAAVDTAHPVKDADQINAHIVEVARSLAGQCDARLHLLHTFEDLIPVVPGEVVTAEAFNDAYERLRGIHRRRFEKFGDEQDIPRAQRHFVYGPSAYALAEFATHSHTDVLVVGTSHRTGLDRFFLGSTAEEILSELRCDVLAVPPQVRPAATKRPQPRRSRRARPQEAAPLSLG